MTMTELLKVAMDAPMSSTDIDAMVQRFYNAEKEFEAEASARKADTEFLNRTYNL